LNFWKDLGNNGTYLLLVREYEKKQTRGRLGWYVNNVLQFCCVTVEPPNLNNQPGKSCIPEGTYECVKEHSPRFKRRLIEVKGVPGRTEIKFHEMNYSRQSLGCIGPGLIHVDIDKDGSKDAAHSKIACQILEQITPSKFTLIITS
jgi:hypothetical protein